MEEKEVEKNLIDLLTGVEQWDYREDLNTVSKLWNNLREILFNNNIGKLNGKPFTDEEFKQIKNNLTFSSNYEAAKHLIGQNGVSHVNFIRDGKTIALDLFYRNQRFGNNVYQVVNQVIIPKTFEMKEQRRFDVTLLINGLPLIQIELKSPGVSVEEAYEQIKKYESEGCYKGIFRFVHLFVISNKTFTKYFAAGDFDAIDKAIKTTWRDENNEVIEQLDDFAKLVLRRPMAYDFITRYTVLEEDTLNSGRKRIIALRPYQINAIKAIEEASKRGKSGYIWHTTGSGKTLTSYKATRNLVNDIPAIEKSIFLVDRKDLDNQTSTAFRAYAINDIVDVDNTHTTHDLMLKFSNDNQQVIVTTIQKLDKLIKDLNSEPDSKYFNKIKSKRIAFVVDECHRTISPEKMKEVRKFFPNSLWYGFTGTPRFEQNKYENNGYALTTDELYGKLNGNDYSNSRSSNPFDPSSPELINNTSCCLHKYTVENAIKDKNVLSFAVTYKASDILEKDTPEFWHTETHMLSVIKDIISSPSIYGLSNGAGNTFESILTVPNIKIAQKYYELFKRVLNGEFPDIKVRKQILETLPDFPKVAISYSVVDDNDNTDKFIYDSDKMAEAISDYNKMFDTSFTSYEFDSYNLDLQNRLKRVGKKYQNRSEQLDIVIVVNRLLTGFDALPIANLFIDRQPAELHSILQMFSRTNRIYPKAHKDHGNIITYQSPKLWQNKVKETISLFTNGGENFALSKPFDELLEEYLQSYNTALSYEVKYKPNNFSDLTELNEDEKRQFVRDVQKYDKVLKAIKTYNEFDKMKQNIIGEEEDDDMSSSSSSSPSEYDLQIVNGLEDNDGAADKMVSYAKMTIPFLNEETLEIFKGIHDEFIKELKTSPTNELKIEEGYDPDYAIDSYDKCYIDLEYITSLMDNFKKDKSKRLEKDICFYISKISLSNPKKAKVLQDHFEMLKENPSAYEDRSSYAVIHEMINSIIEQHCKTLAEKYNLDFETLLFTAKNYISKVDDPNKISNIQKIVENAEYNNLLPYQAKREAKKEIMKVLNEEINPLNK